MTKEELENTTFETIDEENWKKWVLAKGYPNYEVLRLVNLNIGGINVLFYNGEVSQTYANYAKQVKPDTISVGYSNGMIGYLMTARQIEEGGYEPCGSATYFAVAGTYSKEIENIISNIKKIL